MPGSTGMQVNMSINMSSSEIYREYFRYGLMFSERQDRSNVITYILPLLRPLRWDVFTEMFEKVSTSKAEQSIDCSAFYCEECLTLTW